MDTPTQVQQHSPRNLGGQQPVPNATAVLVLGILSIVFCWCYGLIGLILGIIAVALSGKAKRLYEADPGAYTLGSFNNLKAGRICGIIGICLSSLYVVFLIIYVFILGVALTAMPWEQMAR
jgi:hypothetical protein